MGKHEIIDMALQLEEAFDNSGFAFPKPPTLANARIVTQIVG